MVKTQFFSMVSAEGSYQTIAVHYRSENVVVSPEGCCRACKEYNQLAGDSSPKCVAFSAQEGASECSPKCILKSRYPWDRISHIMLAHNKVHDHPRRE